MSYLVLHIDIEFIVGTVCADNGTYYPISIGNEDLLWLYFFNNPHQNSISFGKDNKAHFNNSEINYYGKLYENIEKDQETFTLRGIEHPVIDLLKESGLLETIRKVYQQKTLDNTENIPTLITFSSSIRDNAKQKTVDYFTKHGFQIDSYTIPLAELTTFYALNKKALKFSNGSMVVFLEATNSNLHLIKLTLSDNYFLMDGILQTHEGMGFDPRKLALLRYVVNEVNKATGVLSSDSEKIEEYKRLEMQADEWLKRLDSQTRNNMPLLIRSVSFARTPNMKNDVMVRKDDLDNDTGQYTQDLKDIFDAFKSDKVRGNVAGVFLLGNCFLSDRVKSCFEQMIDKDSLYFYTNKDIRDILAMYPKIDIKRYASEEERIKERAKAEEIMQAEQRSLEDKKRRDALEKEKRKAEIFKKEQDQKEAQNFFDRAVELDKLGKFEDARVNAENAFSLDKSNREYKQFILELIEKIDKQNEKNKLYKNYLNNADKLLQNGDLEKALEDYEAAKFVFENAEIIQKIIDVNRLIKNKEQKNAKIKILISDVQSSIDNNNLLKAKENINEILNIDNQNSMAKTLSVHIEELLKQQEYQYDDFIKSADLFFNIENYDSAIKAYNEALKIKPNDKYCIEKLEIIRYNENIESEKKEFCKKTLAISNNLFNEEKWEEAIQQYEIALTLCPEEKNIKDKIKQCADKLKSIEDNFNELLFEAMIAMKKGNYNQALTILESARKIKPNDTDLKNKINKIKIETIIGQSGDKTNEKSKSTDTKDEGFNFNDKKSNNSIGNNLNKRTQNSVTGSTNEFLKKDRSGSSRNISQEDFLHKTDNIKNSFFIKPLKEKKIKSDQNEDKNDFFKK